ncbi:hypothetical protein HHI36_021101 [Cryptolaemus montrouzieri]|uniref:Peptidase S1 domain-containing protein n=1 Tax=Cryptolaemus montrouzieri TaxID=559131 RepID=A0ABD2MVX2_9CUCU
MLYSAFLLTIFFYSRTYCETHFSINVESYSNSTETIRDSCTCLPFYQCSEESGEVIVDGSGLLDLRNFKNDVCTGDFDVCCNVSKDALSTTTERALKPQGCGYNNPGSYPWSAALLYQDRNQFSPSYKCGVSIIHNKVVVTAAHCVVEDGLYAIRTGNFIRRVSHSIIHPKFSPASLHNDIAVLIMDKPVDTSLDVSSTICIPPNSISLNDTSCIAMGSVNGRHGNHLMTMIELPIVSREKCNNLLRSTRLGEFYQLHKSFVCAGGKENEDTCGGDGGSPLICPIPGQPGRYHQVGIVSWGIGCGNSNIPGVYVNLPYFRQWIDRVMITYGLDITSYRY